MFTIWVLNKIARIVMILIALGLSFLPYSLATLRTDFNPIYCWSFNETEANHCNSTVIQRVYGDPTNDSGGYNFDDTNDWLAVDSNPIPTEGSPRAIGGFIKVGTVTPSLYVWYGNETSVAGSKYAIGVSGTPKLNFWGWGEDEDTDIDPVVGQTWFFVATYDGTNVNIYLNTTWKDYEAASSLVATGNKMFFINQRNAAAGLPPSGTGSAIYSEVFLIPYNLTSQNVTSLYNRIMAGESWKDEVPPVPTLSIDSSMINTSNIGHDQATVKIGFNGSYTLTTGVFNCTLLDNNSVINQSMNINVSGNNYINVSFGEVEKDYLLKLDCNNSDIRDSTEIFKYRVDRIVPVIKSTLVNNSNYTKDDTLSWAWNCTDTNLLAMNSTLKDVNGNAVFNRFNNATANSIFMTNSTSYILTSATTYTYELTCWDSHTARQVKPIQWYIQEGDLFVESINISGDFKELDGQGNDATYFVLDPRGDRYKLKVTFGDQSLSHSFSVEGKDLVYLPKSRYKGHFYILSEERWLDFQGNNVKSVAVSGNNPYTVTVEHFVTTDEIEFESIGDLNRVDSVWTINVLSEEEMQTDYLQQINANIVLIYGVLKMIPIVMLYAIFMVLGYWMIQSGNTISGWMLYVVSFGFDFFFAGQIKEQYLSNAPGFTGTMSFIFVIFLFLWVIAKGTSILYLQRKVKITG